MVWPCAYVLFALYSHFKRNGLSYWSFYVSKPLLLSKSSKHELQDVVMANKDLMKCLMLLALPWKTDLGEGG